MIIDQPGKVNERIWLVGRREACAYLVDGGGTFALLGGAMAYVVPDFLDQLKLFDIDEAKISRIIILHSHFDHCGMVPFLKRRWPWATVTASERARELMKSEKIVENIEMLNQAVLKQRGMMEVAKDLNLSFDGIEVEDVVHDQDRLVLGDLTLEILAVPGHSSCSVAVYAPEQKAIFASDAGGIPFGDEVFTAANSNFDHYQQSLEKMAAREINIYLAEHYGALTGEAGRGFLQKSMAAARTTRAALEQTYADTGGDAEKTAEKITDYMMARAPADFLPREVIALVAGQMVRFIAKKAAAA